GYGLLREGGVDRYAGLPALKSDGSAGRRTHRLRGLDEGEACRRRGCDEQGRGRRATPHAGVCAGEEEREALLRIGSGRTEARARRERGTGGNKSALRTHQHGEQRRAAVNAVKQHEIPPGGPCGETPRCLVIALRSLRGLSAALHRHYDLGERMRRKAVLDRGA